MDPPGSQFDTLSVSRVFEVDIHRVSLQQAADFVVEKAGAGGEPATVVTPNLQHVSLLRSTPALRHAYERADLVVADGVPLVWASRWFGTALPGRVNGTDLVEAVCVHPDIARYRVGFLGGKEGYAEKAAEALRKKNPSLQVACCICPPYGFERDAELSDQMEKQVLAAAPDVLFVALGAPKQEIWMQRKGRALGIPVSLGIGGSFEIIGGGLDRAPRWMQRVGLEWLHRLLSEPGRLWRRYLRCFVVFIQLCAKEVWRKIKTRRAG